MGYLIDPKIFYWMSVLENLGVLLGGILIMSMVAMFIYLIFYFATLITEEEKLTLFKDKKTKKMAITGFVILCIVSSLIPSRATMTQMLVASQVTHENIEGVQQSTTDLIDYIVDKINEVDKEE